jgi:hypothetical protein
MNQLQTNTTQVHLVALTVMLHVSACTHAILRYVNTKTIQRKIQIESKGIFFAVTIFIMVKHKIYNIKLQDL